MANLLSLVVRLGADNRELTRTLSQTEKQISGMTRSIKGIATGIGAAFAVNEIKQFGQAAVKEFLSAQAGMNRLAASVRNSGTDFEAVRKQIEGVTGALEDATTFDDDALAGALQTVVRITNNYKVSLAELETVANVASGAQIELKTAAELVGKVLAGETGTLARYGIVVKDGADAMQLLRDRFKGMATQEAATLEGRIKQLNNEWGNFKEALGGVIVGGNSAGQSVGLLRDHIRNLTSWIESHSGQIAAFRSDLVEIASVAANPIKISIQFIGDSLSILANTIRELRAFQEQSSARMSMLGRGGGGEIFGGVGAGRTWSAPATGGMDGGAGGEGGGLVAAIAQRMDTMLAKSLASYKDSAMARKDTRRDQIGRMFSQFPGGSVANTTNGIPPVGGGMLNAGGVAVPSNGAGALAGGGGISGMIGGLLQTFGPLAAIGTVLASAFKAMEPVIRVLKMPLEALGKLIGGVVNKALSYLAEGIGWLIRSFGKAVNFLLPGNPANGLVAFGQEMMDAAKAARGATDASQKFAESLSNIPRVINLAALRNRIGAGGGGGGGGIPGSPPGSPPGTPPGTPPGSPPGTSPGNSPPPRHEDPAFDPPSNIVIHIGSINSNASNPRQVAEEVGRYIETQVRRGGTSRLAVALG